MKSMLEILKGTRELLSDPKRWIKNSFKERRDGVECYCLVGAMREVAGSYSVPYTLYPKLEPCIMDFERMDTDDEGGVYPIREPIAFNDHPDTTHADILKVLDCAIERAETP